MTDIQNNTSMCHMFSLLSLFDDIATTLDDVSVMSKIALQKASGIMSDDLAVNAGVVDGVNPDRELPIVRAIFVGSLFNKVYCILAVFLFMAIYPPLLSAVMLIGGLYLSYEGVHKIKEKLFQPNDKAKKPREIIAEKDKIKGAVRTDLILSIEIIVIAKSALIGSFLIQLVTLSAVGLATSIIIYGLVALIVKVDDLGLFIVRQGWSKTGMIFVNSMPYTMKGLGIIGTVAMLLVGGGIVGHIFHLPLYANEHLQNLAIGLLVGVVCVVTMNLPSVLFRG